MMLKKLELVSARDPGAQEALLKLHEQLTSFYNSAGMLEYFREAHFVNERWVEGTYHWILREQVRKGMSLLDLGCGSAHAFLNLRDTGAKYSGVDWSENIIKENKKNYGQEAVFLVGSIYNGAFRDDTFDLVFSLYVLEHLVWPHIFLREMVRLVKPGGLIIVICPNYRFFGRMPSLWYGSPSPLKSKLRPKHVFDTLRHVILRNVYYPLRIKIGYPSNTYPFLINLKPSCLSGKWSIDNDAVYFVDREEVVLELGRLGAIDITSELLCSSKPFLNEDQSVCFVAARKIESSASVPKAQSNEKSA